MCYFCWIEENYRTVENPLVKNILIGYNNIIFNINLDRLVDEVVSMSYCHPKVRFPAIPEFFSESIWSGTRYTQSREDNWVATWYGK